MGTPRQRAWLWWGQRMAARHLLEMEGLLCFSCSPRPGDQCPCRSLQNQTAWLSAPSPSGRPRPESDPGRWLRTRKGSSTEVAASAPYPSDRHPLVDAGGAAPAEDLFPTDIR